MHHGRKKPASLKKAEHSYACNASSGLKQHNQTENPIHIYRAAFCPKHRASVATRGCAELFDLHQEEIDIANKTCAAPKKNLETAREQDLPTPGNNCKLQKTFGAKQ
jgi:hypothetical protein